jgi:hypothetical protein
VKPICVSCERFMRPKRNGICFVEGMPTGNSARPGKAEPNKWKPYKLWAGDLWHCPDCRTEIVVGVGMRPLMEHYQDGFIENIVGSGGMKLFVKDC